MATIMSNLIRAFSLRETKKCELDEFLKLYNVVKNEARSVGEYFKAKRFGKEIISKYRSIGERVSCKC